MNTESFNRSPQIPSGHGDARLLVRIFYHRDAFNFELSRANCVSAVNLRIVK
jgi:hypothetical protein